MSCPHCAELEAKIQQLEQQNRQLEVCALTGFLVRGVGMSRLDNVLQRTQSMVFFIDVDNLREMNLPENGAHPNGDRCLRIISATIRNSLRPTDMFIRYGGDELVAVAPAMSPESAVFRAKAIIFALKNLHGLSVTIGVVQTKEKESAESAIKRADELQTVGKHKGKGRVYTNTEVAHVSRTH